MKVLTKDSEEVERKKARKNEGTKDTTTNRQKDRQKEQ